MSEGRNIEGVEFVLKEMKGSEREEGITNGQFAICGRRLMGNRQESLKGTEVRKREGFCWKSDWT